jgi:hypothetical protein
MNTVLSTAPGRHGHPLQPPHDTEPHLPRRVSLIDRAALRLGIALITWGRRSIQLESRERRARYADQQRARLERERQAHRWLSLNLPPR